MNRQDGSTPTAPPAADDERIAGLIRSVADDWHMPPQRLGDSTWRERTGRGVTHRRGRAERTIGPIAAALVATVVLALGAVWLTTPHADRGLASGPSATAGSSAGPTTTSSSRPTPSGSHAATPLPAFQRNRELPTVTNVLVRSDGDFHVADLSTGTLGRAVVGGHLGSTTALVRPGGGWVCVCADWTVMRSEGPGAARIVLEPVAADGSAEAAREIRTLDGVPDPAQPLSAGTPLVDAGTSVSADGRFAFVGWSVRDGADWKAGLEVVDVASLEVVATVPIPVVEPGVKTDRPIIRVAPAVSLSPDRSTILVSSFWYVHDSSTATPPSGNDHWIGRFSGGHVDHLSAAGSTAAARCAELSQGMIDSDRYYVVCSDPSGGMTLERVAADGTVVGNDDLPGIGGGTEGGSLTDRIADALFVWGPITRTLARIDLQTGKVETATAPTALVDGGPFGGLASLGSDLGRWLAPTAGAKTFLDPGIVASPDGKRVYAIGVVGSSDPGSGGSTGVYVFDASTLQAIGHWQPTADFASIALTADGHYLFAAAAGGVDAAGVSSRNGASITVFDTTDGSVDLIAGKLGTSDLFLTDRIVR
jgi:hypothetical protein